MADINQVDICDTPNTGRLIWNENFDKVNSQLLDHITNEARHLGVGAAIDHLDLINIGVNSHITIDTHLADSNIHFSSSEIIHSLLQGLSSDDHLQYPLVTGLRGFTGVVSGITPVLGTHLTTKAYVDAVVQGITSFLASVIDKDLVTPPGGESVGDRYIIAGTGGAWSVGTIDDIVEVVSIGPTVWSFTTPFNGNITVVEDESISYIFNGTEWVKFGGTVEHQQLVGAGVVEHSLIDIHIQSSSEIHFLKSDIDLVDLGDVDVTDIGLNKLLFFDTTSSNHFYSSGEGIIDHDVLKNFEPVEHFPVDDTVVDTSHIWTGTKVRQEAITFALIFG